MGLGRRGFEKGKPAEDFTMEFWEKKETEPLPSERNPSSWQGREGSGVLQGKEGLNHYQSSE